MKLTLPFPPGVNTYWRAPNKGPLPAATIPSVYRESDLVPASAATSIIEEKAK